MSQQILILSSTPRQHGNSDLLCNHFLAGAEAAGHRVEKIRLSDLTIKFCTGCGVCNRTHQCVQKDDMADLLEKLVAADVIVLATPVYFFCLSAQLKTMIDRLCPRYTEISDKRFFLLASAAEDAATTFDGTVAGYRGLLDCLPGAVDAGQILAGGVWQIGDIKSHPALAAAYTAGRSL